MDKPDLAYPGVLAKYAVAQALNCRRVGTRLNIRDVTSPYAQKVKDIHLERLDRYEGIENEWQEIRDPGTGVVLRCAGIQYGDFPTVEWTLCFRNAGDRETPILADICPLDIQVEATAAEGSAKPAGEFRLHHHIGSPCSVEDYPLTPYSQDRKVWMAWQFDCPETGEGLVQAFRREESPEASALPRLRGLDPNATCTLTNLDIAGALEMTGRELLETGLPISIPDRPGAVIVIYAKKEVPNNKKESGS